MAISHLLKKRALIGLATVSVTLAAYAATINSLTETTAPSADDELEIQLVNGGASRKTTIGNLIGSNTDALNINGASQKTIPVGNDELLIADSADNYSIKKVAFSALAGGGISSWTAYTPALSWTSNANANCYYRTVRKELQARCQINTTGVPAPAAILTVSLPNGYLIDASMLIDNSPSGINMGQMYVRYTNGADRQGVIRPSGNSADVRVKYLNQAGSDQVDDDSVTPTALLAFGAGDKINVNFSVPIQ